MSDEKERPDHPRSGSETPRPKGRTQKTKEGFEIPVPTEEDFMADLRRASRRKPTDTP
ncbi:MAG: hypothetical protein KF884_02490 [Fimbriimonadaceae bacterium]|nr:hypothetical protein [Fimbriimonadaceae bacterium]QYK58964.1 MAG: hypothetical protein KF884_02490 [Fimbriimonadaceae bacterium]